VDAGRATRLICYGNGVDQGTRRCRPAATGSEWNVAGARQGVIEPDPNALDATWQTGVKGP
jgi:hypothetical protein